MSGPSPADTGSSRGNRKLGEILLSLRRESLGSRLGRSGVNLFISDDDARGTRDANFVRTLPSNCKQRRINRYLFKCVRQMKEKHAALERELRTLKTLYPVLLQNTVPRSQRTSQEELDRCFATRENTLQGFGSRDSASKRGNKQNSAAQDPGDCDRKDGRGEVSWKRGLFNRTLFNARGSQVDLLPARDPDDVIYSGVRRNDDELSLESCDLFNDTRVDCQLDNDSDNDAKSRRTNSLELMDNCQSFHRKPETGGRAESGIRREDQRRSNLEVNTTARQSRKPGCTENVHWRKNPGQRGLFIGQPEVEDIQETCQKSGTESQEHSSNRDSWCKRVKKSTTDRTHFAPKRANQSARNNSKRLSEMASTKTSRMISSEATPIASTRTTRMTSTMTPGSAPRNVRMKPRTPQPRSNVHTAHVPMISVAYFPPFETIPNLDGFTVQLLRLAVLLYAPELIPALNSLIARQNPVIHLPVSYPEGSTDLLTQLFRILNGQQRVPNLSYVPFGNNGRNSVAEAIQNHPCNGQPREILRPTGQRSISTTSQENPDSRIESYSRPLQFKSSSQRQSPRVFVNERNPSSRRSSFGNDDRIPTTTDRPIIDDDSLESDREEN